MWANPPFATAADSEVDLYGYYDPPLNKEWKTTLGAVASHNLAGNRKNLGWGPVGLILLL